MGSFGFPISDASAGGTQLFANGALAGSPVQAVMNPVLAKWAALKYENGAAGRPSAAATAFASQSGYSGVAQAFTGGVIYGITNSNLTGQGFFVSGPVLARYLAAGGPSGELGVPLSDQFVTNGISQQNFENGYISYAPGAASAQEVLTPRTPSISANPTTALAGSRLHLAISGFANGATIRVSVTGQPDFTVTTPNGSYGWDIYVSPSAVSATVAVRAVDTAGSAVASGSYAVKSLLDAHAQLSKTGGDNQTGPPATVLTLPLVVLLADNTGTPIPNVAVTFTASPGAVVTTASTLTDASGRASTAMRLPPAGGVAAVTARAAGQIAIFDARATGSTGIANFPQFSQAAITSPLGAGQAAGAQKGALVTAAAAILRYYQNLGTIPSAHGLADPAKLNQFLTADCTKTCDGFVSNPDDGEQVVNLWRLVDFPGSGVTVSVENPALSSIAALITGGDPVLVNLSLTEDGVAAGGTSVVATGIAADGSLQISDPNPGFAQTSLNGYLGGFSAGGHVWKGTVLSAVRLLPQASSPIGFVLQAVSQPVATFPAVSVSAAAGVCAAPLHIQDAAVAGAAPANPVRQSEFIYCDGTQPAYQVSVSAAQAYHAGITDLASGGSDIDLSAGSSGGYTVTRTGGALTASAPSVSFTSAAVVNAASFHSGISPGELISIFGSGLSGPGAATSVTVGGVPAQVLLASPFQINAVVPPALPAGDAAVAVTSSFGFVSQQASLQAAAPGIFVLSSNADGTVNGAVVNQDGTINGPANPAVRGSVITVYCTGLGAVTARGNLSVAALPVQAVVGGNSLPVAFAGLTPGFVGLYQVNVSVPLPTPPGLALSLSLSEGDAASNAVAVAIQ